MGSLGVTYGPEEAPTSLVFTDQFKDDELAYAFDAPFDFDGRIEQIKSKDTTATLPPGSVVPARQSAAIARGC